MARGIIEIEMAENCHECVFYHSEYFGNKLYRNECRLVGKAAHSSSGRPEWCPLKEVKE